MELRICHLYPDVLNLYGDQGNIICMSRRLKSRGIDVSVSGVCIGDSCRLTDFDLFFIGGGQDFEQEVLLGDLASGRAADIRAAVDDGKTFLTICGGYQMMGTHYVTSDGVRCDFIGALDLYTVGRSERMIGNMMFKCSEQNGGSMIVGFENHSGRTYLGPGCDPLGTVVCGSGNNGEDGTEGARYKNVFGSYSHGPILPKNPAFADFVLENAPSRRYGEVHLDPLDDKFELAAHEYMIARLAK